MRDDSNEFQIESCDAPCRVTRAARGPVSVSARAAGARARVAALPCCLTTSTRPRLDPYGGWVACPALASASDERLRLYGERYRWGTQTTLSSIRPKIAAAGFSPRRTRRCGSEARRPTTCISLAIRVSRTGTMTPSRRSRTPTTPAALWDAGTDSRPPLRRRSRRST